MGIFDNIGKNNKTNKLLNDLNNKIDSIQKNVDKYEKGDVLPKREEDKYDPVIVTGNLYSTSIETYRSLLNREAFYMNIPTHHLLKVDSGYNYSTFDRLLKDGYVYRSMEVYSSTLLSQGYEFVGEPRDVQYVKDYLARMEDSNMTSLDDTIRKMLYHLRKYGIGYLSFIRGNDSSKQWTDNEGNVHKPIIGLAMEDARTMSIIYDNQPFKLVGYIQVSDEALIYGNPTGHTAYKISNPKFSPPQVFNYLQQLLTNYIHIPYWSPIDMLYLQVPNDVASIFPMPPLYPVIDDLRSLRDIEAILDMVIYQYGSPMVQVAVDIEDPQVAITEANKIVSKMKNMEPNGIIGTWGKAKINVVKLTEQLSQLDTYLKYYTGRLFSDLGVTAISLGDISNGGRASADIGMRVIDVGIEMYQNVLTKYLNIIINEIIQTKYNSPNAIGIVKFKFNNVDIQQKIARESHYLNLFNAGIVTRTEVRKQIGYTAPVDDKDTVFILKEEGKLQGMPSPTDKNKNNLITPTSAKVSQNVLKTGKNQYGNSPTTKVSKNV